MDEMEMRRKLYIYKRMFGTVKLKIQSKKEEAKDPARRKS
jgi:hypothetical protein